MNKKIYIIVVALCALAIDQITKVLIVKEFLLNESLNIIDNFFALTYIRNTGAAWGILSNNILFLVVVTLIVVFLLNKWVFSDFKTNKLTIVSFGLLNGGIIGNLIDRVFRGYVVDFFHFNIFGYNFPVFNMADTFIVVGVFLLIIDLLRSDMNVRKMR